MHAVLDTIIEGQIQDLRVFPGEDEGKLAALETREDLDRYTYLVAGCVGEFWTEVHVAHRPRLARWDLPRMRALGMRFGKGLQLTNVLRDVPARPAPGPLLPAPPGPGPARASSRATCSTRAARRAARPLLGEWLDTALDHYEAGWQYTFAIPRREARMRLACAWPLLIGLRTLDLLAASPNWLDPAITLKVPRVRVYGLMAHSLGTVWSTRALGRQARRLRERIRP